VQNTSSAASYNSVILGDISALTTAQTFPTGTGLSTSQSVTDYSASSASWIDSQYQSTSNSATYQSTLLSQSTQVLSNATGVNIDSQMSMMLEFENSYQASAKLISTINAMFGSLLQAVA
jgi:flagellar hook-associated protein 1 FlgK